MKNRYPFKFLDSYEKDDKFIFFGRDEEINELYDMVFQSSVILLYGASGTGKTSLINCGLAGKFQPHDWFPFMIRRGSNINDSLEKSLKDAGGNFSETLNDINWEDDFTNESSEAETFLSPIGNAIKSIYQNSFRPIYLIFDQFEELFILGSSSEQELFINTIKDILSSQQPVKIIFSIREEYLGHLFDFEQAVPQLMQKKLRIEPMNLAKVKQVILGATEFEGSLISLKEGEVDEIATGIFNKIKGEQKSLTIQLPFLQVFLDKFYRNVTGDPKRQTEAQFSVKVLNEMSEIGDILVDFLEEQVGEIAKNLRPKYPNINSEMVWKILSPLSTIEGTKEPISKVDLYGRLMEIDHNKIDDTIEAFINRRILRYNENTELYEISHDALAKPISEKRSVKEKTLLEIRRMIGSQVNVKKEAREFFTQRQIHFIEPYLSKIELSQEENKLISDSRISIRKSKRRKKFIIAASFTIITLALFFMVGQSYSLKELEVENMETIKELIDRQIASRKDSVIMVKAKQALIASQARLSSTLAISEKDKNDALAAKKTAIAAVKKAENAEIQSDTARYKMRKIAINGWRTIDLFRKEKSRGGLSLMEKNELDTLSKNFVKEAKLLRVLTPYKIPNFDAWGYKDSQGNIAIFPKFTLANEFEGDVAIVKLRGDNTIYQINKNGDILGLLVENDNFIWEKSGKGQKKPDNMFIGGLKVENGDTIEYCVCRSPWVGGGNHIGRLEKEDDKCHFGWGGVERITDEYDVLTKSQKFSNYKWVPQEDIKNHEGKGWVKFIGGWNEDNNGYALYIGQSKYKDQLMPGKIWERTKNNYVVFDGKEIEMKKYSYLMIKK